MYVHGRSPQLQAMALKERLCSQSLLINLQLVEGAERMSRTSQTSSTVEKMQICFLCPDRSHLMTQQQREDGGTLSTALHLADNNSDNSALRRQGAPDGSYAIPPTHRIHHPSLLVCAHTHSVFASGNIIPFYVTCSDREHEKWLSRRRPKMIAENERRGKIKVEGERQRRGHRGR
ncbi:hypothetical protein Q8A73_004178 [Channa argus]|nr:hypothetical protein Q8A73_004178 [Channa argus]